MAHDVEQVVHSSEGLWFDLLLLHLHVEVSLGEILDPKLPVMVAPSVFECVCMCVFVHLCVPDEQVGTLNRGLCH